VENTTDEKIMSVYYKIIVTRDNLECVLYWWEKTYSKLMELVNLLYDVAKVDAVELEMINKKEYENNI
jgi:hypothetical protein